VGERLRVKAGIAPLKRGLTSESNHPLGWARNASELLPIAGVEKLTGVCGQIRRLKTAYPWIFPDVFPRLPRSPDIQPDHRRACKVHAPEVVELLSLEIEDLPTDYLANMNAIAVEDVSVHGWPPLLSRSRRPDKLRQWIVNSEGNQARSWRQCSRIALIKKDRPKAVRFARRALVSAGRASAIPRGAGAGRTDNIGC
jgi:hypothetical protein